MMDLKGRYAVITGANQGLGRAIATAFVKAGASVLLTARNTELLDRVVEELKPKAAAGQQVIGMRGDVADEASCAAVMARARESFPELTALVNNAGVYGPMGPIETVDWDVWVQAIRINLLGTVMMCRQAIPWMRGRGYGKIVNLSGGGATAPLPNISAYAASKAAVVRITETFAEELREARVDVNSIAPGALNTRLLDQVLAAGPEKVGAKFYERSLKQRDSGGAPPERGAELAVWLASAESDGITGKLISAVWDPWETLAEHAADLKTSDVYTLRRIVPQDRGLGWGDR